MRVEDAIALRAGPTEMNRDPIVQPLAVRRRSLAWLLYAAFIAVSAGSARALSEASGLRLSAILEAAALVAVTFAISSLLLPITSIVTLPTQASREQLRIGHMVIPCGSIRSTWLFRDKGGATLRIRKGRWRAIEIVLPDIGAGREILGALGRDIAHGASSFRAGIVNYGHGTAVVGVVLLAACGVLLYYTRTVAVFAPVVFSGILVLVLLELPLWSRVTVGAEGVEISSFRRARFLPIATVVGVKYYRQRRNTVTIVQLILDSGNVVEIPAWSLRRARAIVERVDAAIELRSARLAAEERGATPVLE